jgi:hypothetical protein
MRLTNGHGLARARFPVRRERRVQLAEQLAGDVEGYVEKFRLPPTNIERCRKASETEDQRNEP